MIAINSRHSLLGILRDPRATYLSRCGIPKNPRAPIPFLEALLVGIFMGTVEVKTIRRYPAKNYVWAFGGLERKPRISSVIFKSNNAMPTNSNSDTLHSCHLPCIPLKLRKNNVRKIWRVGCTYPQTVNGKGPSAMFKAICDYKHSQSRTGQPQCLGIPNEPLGIPKESLGIPQNP